MDVDNVLDNTSTVIFGKLCVFKVKVTDGNEGFLGPGEEPVD